MQQFSALHDLVCFVQLCCFWKLLSEAADTLCMQANVRALQATCIDQLEDELERQGTQLRHEQLVARMLHTQLIPKQT